MFIHFDSLAQVNLVPNPSFEELDSCAQLEQFLENGIVDWYVPTPGTSDLYNGCAGAGDGAGVPYNFQGWQEARTGIGYAGLIPYEDIYFMGQTGWFVDTREYIQVELDEYLIEGGTYNVSFFVSASDTYSTCFVSGIGACVTSTAISTSIPWGLLDVEEQAVSMELLSDSVNWVEISGEFISTGNEKFLTIGNFLHDSEIQIACESDTIERRSAYYFIDDVSLVLDSIAYELIAPNVLTPNNDGINDFFSVDLIGYLGLSVKIYNRWGREVYASKFDDLNWPNEHEIDGVYFFVIALQKLDNSVDYKKGYVQLIR